ncbi:MAG: 50S ribosomal protein L5 [archaeon]
MKEDNIMRKIELDAVTLHCSTADQADLEKCRKLLKLITGGKIKDTIAKKRIPTFKIRPGLTIGCKITLRGKKAEEILKMILVGLPNAKESNFSDGFLSFGIKEYIEIPTIPYQREIGIIGFEVVAKLKRKGERIKKRRIKKSRPSPKQKITQKETIKFFTENFKINLEDIK